METRDILDVSSDLDLFVLHYVYIPRINQCLDLLATAHNNHKVSTENNRTSLQLLNLYGHLSSSTNINTAIVRPRPQNTTPFGLWATSDDNENILSDYYIDHLLQNLPALPDDDNEGLTVYEAVREYVHEYCHFT